MAARARRGDNSKRTLFVTHPHCAEHRIAHHPEQPKRVQAIEAAVLAHFDSVELTQTLRGRLPAASRGSAFRTSSSGCISRQSFAHFEPSLLTFRAFAARFQSLRCSLPEPSLLTF